MVEENLEKKDVEKKDALPKNSFFDIELKTTLLSAIVGAIIGYASFIINSPPTSLGLAVIVLIAMIMAMKKMTKSTKNIKWWLSNSAIVYLLVWFIIWTIFFNTKII